MKGCNLNLRDNLCGDFEKLNIWCYGWLMWWIVVKYLYFISMHFLKTTAKNMSHTFVLFLMNICEGCCSPLWILCDEFTPKFVVTLWIISLVNIYAIYLWNLINLWRMLTKVWKHLKLINLGRMLIEANAWKSKKRKLKSIFQKG